MAQHYQFLVDEISAVSDNDAIRVTPSFSSINCSDPVRNVSRVQEEDKIWLHPWPKVIGITQILSGFITSMLGVAEVFIIPLGGQNFGEGMIYVGKKNCYGIGIIAGFVLVITGSTAIRASISQRLTTVSRFLNLTLGAMILYSIFTALLIVGYLLKWTVKSNYPKASTMYGVHIFMTLSCLLGFLFTLVAFFQYFNQIFFGELHLFRRWLEMCCPCMSGSTCCSKDSSEVYQISRDADNV